MWPVPPSPDTGRPLGLGKQQRVTHLCTWQRRLDRSSCSPSTLTRPGACPTHRQTGLTPATLLSFPFPSLPQCRASLSSRGTATHPSLAKAGGLFLVCGSAGLGAAGWSAEALPPETALLAGPPPGILRTTPLSRGPVRHQGLPPDPAYRWRSAH